VEKLQTDHHIDTSLHRANLHFHQNFYQLTNQDLRQLADLSLTLARACGFFHFSENQNPALNVVREFFFCKFLAFEFDSFCGDVNLAK
jgi:hypothetical protein